MGSKKQGTGTGVSVGRAGGGAGTSTMRYSPAKKRRIKQARQAEDKDWATRQPTGKPFRAEHQYD